MVRHNFLMARVHKSVPENDGILFHCFEILHHIYLSAASHSLQGQGCPRHHRCSLNQEPLLYLNHKYKSKRRAAAASSTRATAETIKSRRSSEHTNLQLAESLNYQHSTKTINLGNVPHQPMQQ